MAPFAKGARGARGTGRGSVSSRGRGGIFPRGRGASRGKRPTFHSTRVEEPHAENSDQGQASDSETPGVIEEYQGIDSSENDAEDTAATIKPYNVLLQSLSRKSNLVQPLRKKRKVVLDDGSEQQSKGSKSEGSVKLSVQEDIDRVDEPEEGGNLPGDDMEDVNILDDIGDASDPFESHLSAVDDAVLAGCIKDAAESRLATQKPILHPGWKALSVSYQSNPTHFDTSFHPFKRVNEFQLKQRLEAPAGRLLRNLDGLNGHLAAYVFTYQDVLFCDRVPRLGQDLRNLMCLHALNHVLKTRDRVIKNNARISRSEATDDIEYRDQGFTRPKVLMLLPTRQACVKAVNTIISLCEPEQQENKKRFQDSYTQPEDGFSEDKPEDFRELFGGNDDDMFRLGMKFTRKTVKYFSQFYNSDIIFASPLGLRMAIGAEDAKKQDHDFLSSIEVIIVDQADALLMQNWEHVEYIFDHLNLQPKETHGCDFGRVRNWYLDGHARYFRQTIVLTAFNTPELNRLFGHHMLNMAGRVKVCKDDYNGSMLDLAVQIKQSFSRFESPQPVADPDARFKYFTTTIAPSLTKLSKMRSGTGHGVLIFIPSYMDFVRVRNFLANSNSTQHLSFGSISEYTSVRDVARARSHFFSGRHSVLLYTGRAHHFRRYHLRGARSVILYALPDNPIFYQEIAGGYLGTSIAEGRVDPMEANVRSIFSKWDLLKLERVVGSKRSAAMLKEKGGDTFEFL